MKSDWPPIRNWKPLRSGSLAAAAGMFAFFAGLRSLFLVRWLAKADMTMSDVPTFLALASQNPPGRPFSAVEVVVLRRSLTILQFLVAAIVFLVAYFVSKRRARAEKALLSYCLELEEELRRTASTHTHEIGPNESRGI